jgi:DNA-binding CsgD family transcriptional regulator
MLSKGTLSLAIYLEGLENPINMQGVYVNELPDNATTVTMLKRKQKYGFSPEETEQIIVDYTLNHLTVYELAAKYGCHRSTISKHLKQNSVTVTHRKMDDKLIKEAIRLYEAGLSLKTVGELMRIPKTTVRHTLIRAGVTLRPARRKPRQTRQEEDFED